MPDPTKLSSGGAFASVPERIAAKERAVERELTRYPAFESMRKRTERGTYILTGPPAYIKQSMDRPGVAPATRPKSADGGSTFHFSITTVSKGSRFTSTLGGSRPGSAAAHAAYIERDGAAEKLPGVALSYDNEIANETWTALGGQEYIERPAVTERIGVTLASFGNIADTFEERLEFWTALESIENTPRTHILHIHRDKDPDFWKAVDGNPEAPAFLKTHLAVQTLDDQQAVQVQTFIRAHALKKGGGASIEPGRGGRIQTRIIIELPYELSPEDRLLLVQQFCDSQFKDVLAYENAKDKAAREKLGSPQPLVDIPYWAVIHAPDIHNDPRNSHVHITFSERPAKQIVIGDKKTWDFLHAEERVDNHRKKRIFHPMRQNRVRKFKWIGWPKAARVNFADLANKLLKARGIDKNIDPRSYKDMGIDVLPGVRIAPKEYTLEKKGIATKNDEAIAQQWARLIADLDKRHKAARIDVAMTLRFEAQGRRWKQFGHPVAQMLNSVWRRWKAATLDIAHYKAEEAAFGVVIEKIRSRLDPPLKDKVPMDPSIKGFLKHLVDNGMEVARRHLSRAKKEKTLCERYLRDVEAQKTPIAGDIFSETLHKLIPTVHPSKILGINAFIDSVGVLADLRAREIEPDFVKIREGIHASLGLPIPEPWTGLKKTPESEPVPKTPLPELVRIERETRKELSETNPFIELKQPPEIKIPIKKFGAVGSNSAASTHNIGRKTSVPAKTPAAPHSGKTPFDDRRAASASAGGSEPHKLPKAPESPPEPPRQSAAPITPPTAKPAAPLIQEHSTPPAALSERPETDAPKTAPESSASWPTSIALPEGARLITPAKDLASKPEGPHKRSMAPAAPSERPEAAAAKTAPESLLGRPASIALPEGARLITPAKDLAPAPNLPFANGAAPDEGGMANTAAASPAPETDEEKSKKKKKRKALTPEEQRIRSKIIRSSGGPSR